ncbi:glutathione S-transferase family protein [Erwinia sp.]|uniref:glutathione S-transferase family protein n=1 Tax=Erwinia citreus TaxID=558 RepID=UPI003C70FB0F
MLKFYYHPTPNPLKVALFLEEAELPFELIAVDTAKGEQHSADFRTINPNGKVPAIEDDGTRIFDSNAILLYLAEKNGKFLGHSSERGELLSWLMFIASGLGPFSGQSVHFQRAAPEKITYAQNRYLREAERHYSVLNTHLNNREFIVGDEFTIADISAWAWVDRADFVLGEGRLSEFPEVERWFQTINSRSSVSRVRLIGKDIEFKTPNDDESRRMLYPSNYSTT